MSTTPALPVGSVPPSRYVAFVVIAAVGCALDLWVKSWMFAELGMPVRDKKWWIWEGVFGFQTSLNQGALFGMGQGFTWLFATLSVLAAFMVLYWLFWLRAARDWLLCIALAGITAGVFGNLYDRLGLHGLAWPAGYELEGQPLYAVRDYILVMIGEYHWPNFNIADSLLVGGAGLLIWHSFFGSRHDDRPFEAAPTDA